MLRILTAGESHGPSLTAIIDGFPFGLAVDFNLINDILKRRQTVPGRGNRMAIEDDHVMIESGIRNGITIGSPITIKIANHDYDNWKGVDDSVTIPRPGHADLSGALKYNTHNIRNIIERASARETAIKTAAGALCLQLLDKLNICVTSEIVSIGNVIAPTESQMLTEIERARSDGDSLGGVCQVTISGLLPGVGSYTQSDLKLSARLGYAALGVNGVKGVQFGHAFSNTQKTGYDANDDIFYSDTKQFYRKTNYNAGLEGGMSNGEDIVVQCAVKPLSSIKRVKSSVDLISKEAVNSRYERSDVCAVPATSIVLTAVLGIELTKVVLEQFSGNTMAELERNYLSYKQQLESF